jgi:hypothetical protein
MTLIGPPSSRGRYSEALSGVYVHHCAGQILYVGKTTTGTFGTFGERLRRQFQTKAAGDSDLHKLLCSQTQEIRSYLLEFADLEMMVDAGPMPLSPARKALIMEQVLIGILEPPGNKV